MSDPREILVTGFLGAGKTRLAEHLREQGQSSVYEADGASDPLKFPGINGNWLIICAVDAANHPGLLRDPDLSPLTVHQIRCADLIALTKLDIIDGSEARTLLADLVDKPMADAPLGHFDLSTLEGSLASFVQPEPLGKNIPAFEDWHYRGPLRLQTEQAENLAELRPKSAYRFSGVVRTPEGGLEIEIAGRFRQTRPIEPPEETVLQARGLKGRFRPADLDVLLSELAADSASRMWLFNHR